jgi:hypothetical protein
MGRGKRVEQLDEIVRYQRERHQPELVTFESFRVVLLVRDGSLEKRQVLTVTLRFQTLDRDKPKGGRIDAVPEPGGRGTIIKDMAQMRIRVHRTNLVPDHQE